MSAVAQRLRGVSPGLQISVTDVRRPAHRPSPVAPGFSPPSLAIGNSFPLHKLALGIAIARTSALLEMPYDLLVRMRQRAEQEIEDYLSITSEFTTSPNFKFLADADRTAFAGRIGAGMTDLLMNSLGYVWRSNAEHLGRVSGVGLSPHADFIYGGGAASDHGVVLAESRGSFSQTTTKASTIRNASKKYSRQVKPLIGINAPEGKVVHGYSVAFGCAPQTANAFFGVVEKKVSRPRVLPDDPNEPEDRGDLQGVILATCRANFALIDAPAVGREIDSIPHFRSRSQRPEKVIQFIRWKYQGQCYITGPGDFATELSPWGYTDNLGSGLSLSDLISETGLHPRQTHLTICMREDAATLLLNFLTSKFSRQPTDARLFSMSFPHFGPKLSDRKSAKMDVHRDHSPNIVEFRDGLVATDFTDFEPVGIMEWHPQSGYIG